MALVADARLVRYILGRRAVFGYRGRFVVSRSSCWRSNGHSSYPFGGIYHHEYPHWMEGSFFQRDCQLAAARKSQTCLFAAAETIPPDSRLVCWRCVLRVPNALCAYDLLGYKYKPRYHPIALFGQVHVQAAGSQAVEKICYWTPSIEKGLSAPTYS